METQRVKVDSAENILTRGSYPGKKGRAYICPPPGSMGIHASSSRQIRTGRVKFAHKLFRSVPDFTLRAPGDDMRYVTLIGADRCDHRVFQGLINLPSSNERRTACVPFFRRGGYRGLPDELDWVEGRTRGIEYD